MTKEALLEKLSQNFNHNIVKAFFVVKRETFVEDKYKQYAYDDRPLPIGDNATISQPTTIAFMLELLELKNNQKILEIGSGCGYVLALINQISLNSDIYGIEINEELVEKSKKLIKEKNIHIIQGDGSSGFEKEQVFDRILVSAAFVEEPIHLLKQLKKDGILISPVGNYIMKYNNGKSESYYGFSFVPITKGDKNAHI